MVVSTTQYGEPEMFWSVSGSHTEVLILDKILWKILGQGFLIFNIFFKDRYLSLSAKATFRLGQFSYCYQTTQQGSEPDQNTKVRIPPPAPETKRGTVNYNKTQVRQGNIAELSVPERYDGGALGALERSVVLNVILNLLLVGCVVRSRCEGCILWTWDIDSDG